MQLGESFYRRNVARIAAALTAAGHEAALFVPYLEAESAALGWLGDIRWYPEFPSQPAPEEWMAREAGVSKLALDIAEASTYTTLCAAVEEVSLTAIVEQ